VLADWKNGIDTEWPRKPSYRFDIGERVECRVGPHPVTGWAPGRIVKHNYTQPGWPPGSFAPYQIWLHDGRLIFAPQDTDAVIRLRAPNDSECPPSPPLPDHLRPEDADDDYDEEQEEEEEGGRSKSEVFDFQGADEEDASK
jgi:hypothetical protein